MTTRYVCSSCGVATVAAEQLCNPREEEVAEYCGSAPERDALCSTMRKHLAFVCGKCGRPAQQSELLCQPLALG